MDESRPLTKLLRRLLEGKLLPEEIEEVAGGFDAIGDLAVVKLPETFAQERKELVAKTLLSEVKTLKAVWNQVGPVDGDFRIRRLEFLGGEARSTTLYTEFGCRFMVDIAKMYFSPRLSTERARIAELVGAKEEVFNMFSGVGTYSIVIAKRHRDVVVYSCEINKEAYDYMVGNVALNKVQGQVAPLLGDCADLWKRLYFGVDRVIMPLPERAKEYLQYAVKVCRPNAVIHYYAHVATEDPKPYKVAWDEVKGDYPQLSLEVGKVVREVGPRVSQVVLDLRFKP
jgi:tRNA (guanine37-N1)-methyltransferase